MVVCYNPAKGEKIYELDAYIYRYSDNDCYHNVYIFNNILY